MIGRTLARPTERVDPSQQRQSLEVGTVRELLGIARIKIHEGKLDEYKKLAAEFMELARTKDTGALQYDLFFNHDYSECVVIERYRDSEALLQHSANQGDMMAGLLEICTISGEVCGSPSPELKSALESYGVQVFSPYMSL
jgi:quinol monooxygenase YgiN